MDVTFTLLSGDQNNKQLQKDWQGLFVSECSSNSFLAWSWIGNWLAQQSLPVYQLRACKKDEIYGLALFTLNETTTGTIQLRLHKSGIEELDQVWIEYNDFLLRKENAESIRQDMLTHLVHQQEVPWDELYIDMTHQENQFTHSELLKRTTLISIGFQTDFRRLQGKALIESFSKNTQKQLLRSQKLLSKQGNINLIVESNEQQKLTCLQAIAHLHQIQWQHSQWGSGFNNDKFVEFHQKLITEPNSVVVKLMLDEQPLAYGYYLCCNDKVDFYLSAMKKSKDNRIKVGLVLHWLAMEHFFEQGARVYDFLAGDARYKRSLSNIEYEMHSICLYKPRMKLKILQAIRRIKNKMKQRVK